VANEAANRCVTVFAIKWNTAASIYNTTVLHKPHGAHHEAKIVCSELTPLAVYVEIFTPHSFCVALKLGFISVDM